MYVVGVAYRVRSTPLDTYFHPGPFLSELRTANIYFGHHNSARDIYPGSILAVALCLRL